MNRLQTNYLKPISKIQAVESIQPILSKKSAAENLEKFNHSNLKKATLRRLAKREKERREGFSLEKIEKRKKVVVEEDKKKFDNLAKKDTYIITNELKEKVIQSILPKYIAETLSSHTEVSPLIHKSLHKLLYDLYISEKPHGVSAIDFFTNNFHTETVDLAQGFALKPHSSSYFWDDTITSKSESGTPNSALSAFLEIRILNDTHKQISVFKKFILRQDKQDTIRHVAVQDKIFTIIHLIHNLNLMCYELWETSYLKLLAEQCLQEAVDLFFVWSSYTPKTFGEFVGPIISIDAYNLMINYTLSSNQLKASEALFQCLIQTTKMGIIAWNQTTLNLFFGFLLKIDELNAIYRQKQQSEETEIEIESDITNFCLNIYFYLKAKQDFIHKQVVQDKLSSITTNFKFFNTFALPKSKNPEEQEKLTIYSLDKIIYSLFEDQKTLMKMIQEEIPVPKNSQPLFRILNAIIEQKLFKRTEEIIEIFKKQEKTQTNQINLDKEMAIIYQIEFKNKVSSFLHKISLKCSKFSNETEKNSNLSLIWKEFQQIWLPFLKEHAIVKKEMGYSYCISCSVFLLEKIILSSEISSNTSIFSSELLFQRMIIPLQREIFNNLEKNQAKAGKVVSTLTSHERLLNLLLQHMIFHENKLELTHFLLETKFERAKSLSGATATDDWEESLKKKPQIDTKLSASEEIMTFTQYMVNHEPNFSFYDDTLLLLEKFSISLGDWMSILWLAKNYQDQAQDVISKIRNKTQINKTDKERLLVIKSSHFKNALQTLLRLAPKKLQNFEKIRLKFVKLRDLHSEVRLNYKMMDDMQEELGNLIGERTVRKIFAAFHQNRQYVPDYELKNQKDELLENILGKKERKEIENDSEENKILNVDDEEEEDEDEEVIEKDTKEVFEEIAEKQIKNFETKQENEDDEETIENESAETSTNPWSNTCNLVNFWLEKQISDNFPFLDLLEREKSKRKLENSFTTQIPQKKRKISNE